MPLSAQVGALSTAPAPRTGPPAPLPPAPAPRCSPVSPVELGEPPLCPHVQGRSLSCSSALQLGRSCHLPLLGAKHQTQPLLPASWYAAPSPFPPGLSPPWGSFWLLGDP